MKTLKEYIYEDKKVDFTKIDFSDFCNLLDDCAYNRGDWAPGISPNVIKIKDVFGKDYISCNVTGLSNTNQILKKLYRFAKGNVDYIYVDRTSKKCIGVRCIKGGNYTGYMYITNMSELLECFGEENLNKIYKFISK